MYGSGRERNQTPQTEARPGSTKHHVEVGVPGAGTGVLAAISGRSKRGSSRGGARVRAALPGLAVGARVRVPMGTVAWDELASACARAEIRTRGPGEQLQPNPGQKRGNRVSANLPAVTRSTRNRHSPQLPARRRPRPVMPPRGRSSGAPRLRVGGADTRQCRWLVGSRASLLPLGSNLRAPWLPVGGALGSFLSRGRGFRGPWLLLGGTGNPIPAPPRSPGWSSVSVLTRVVRRPTYHGLLSHAQPTDLPAWNLLSRKKSGTRDAVADSELANSSGSVTSPCR